MFFIEVESREASKKVRAVATGPSLWEHLCHHQVPVKSSCMGKGVCHQCRVRVKKGVAPVSATDTKAFSKEDLKQGWRLSCQFRPRASLSIYVPQTFHFQDDLKVHRQPEGSWWVACDLGTTGVELVAVDQQGVWATIKSLNRQVQMGADVMTRLEYAQNQGLERLQRVIHRQLKKLTEKLIKAASSAMACFTEKVWLAGNSAVTSFVAGWPIESLAVAPYEPAHLGSSSLELGEWQIETLPLIHSFVGGDLFAGLFWLWEKGLCKSEDSWVLMDVGTNSEMLFWNGAELFISSTPAGPAFEGSSISIGMRAEPGALMNPVYDSTSKSWNYKVVGGDTLRGICGSGLIAAIDQAVTNQLVSEDGELLQPEGLCFQNSICLNQADIREFQLAKSAIRTGLELVMDQGPRPANQLYLAGSFGENLPLEACWRLDLLPRMPTEALGNTCLRGTMAWAQAEPEDRQAFQDWLASVQTPIELALRNEFQQRFVENMGLRAAAVGSK